MKANEELEVFRQALAPRQLNPLARSIVARINGGRSAPIAGFVWHRPSRARQANPENRDLFHSRELAHLLFLRWLSHTGRLAA